jgi:predicted ATPase
MITHLNIQNFKSYQDISLSMGNLTILCGQNGMGKSTILQSLLLLRQSHLLGRLEEGLELNGDLCQIGSSQDALFYAPNSNNIKISLGLGEGKEANWSFKVGNGTDNFLFAEESEKNRTLLDSCGIFSRKNFQYISSSRNPMEFYPKKDYEVIQNRQLSLSNGGGELVAHFLDYYKNETVTETLRNKNARFSDLLSQTIAWEREISSNINVNVGRLGEYYQITYSFNSNSGFKTPDFKSNNVGFGIGYTLPLIVAILSAKPGSVLLLENPEAHLHPHAQAKMAELMCLAAQAGIQIILETHSDHIINGTLVSIKKQLIDINEVKIYYIDREEEMLASRATEIELIKGGKIKNQPKGFFDQMQIDLKILMGF